jgi:3'-phosphoadenosine 5'-phosphosulfate (PAPS) 3'-phosphatase
MALLPGSRLVGEEATTARPPLMGELDRSDVWLVDPLDGTAHLHWRRPDFSAKIALPAPRRNA